ncbi:ribonuclease H-like domain-containing protein [Tanacetum coccineum]
MSILNVGFSGAYKAGLESVEARLDVYKKNEVVFEDDIKILKLDIKLRDNALTELRKKFEKAKKERDDLKLTLEKFENSSKNLSKLLEIQVSDKFKTGVGYDSQVVDSQVFDSQVNDKYKTSEGFHAVPPSYTGNFMPPKPNLVLADEEEYVFGESITSVPAVATSKVKTSESKPKSVSEPLIEDWISDSEDENETEFKSKQRKLSFSKVEFVKSNEHVKIPRESVENVENNKQDCDFYEKKMVEKPVWNNASRVNHQNSQRLTHPHLKGNFVPKAVLIKSGHKTLNTARQNFSKAAVSVNTGRPINTVYLRPIVNSASTISNVFNRAHLHVRRPFNKFTTNKNSNLNEKVNSVRRNVTIVGSKAVVSDNKGNKANVVKASTCWVWRTKQQVSDHVSRHNGASMNFKRFDYGNPQLELQEKGVIDNGCSRHMTGNKSYLSDYEEIDGGFVAFGGDPKGGKITSKGKISTGKLDFEDVYFVKELKFNLFSVSQMCDKKNSVLFTDTECVVLSPDFKLPDENHVLLRVPRKDNMYSVDLKNIIPSGGLTCLFAKATLDESNLWHRRLGHINFKTINKLVKGNLVRGLPSKLFEINQTCVACQKGKQHKASCIENLIDLKVKVIRCDNETKFKNKVMNQFCEMKGIKREFSVARTPQQNRVAERKNRTLIKAARTMLADSKLPTTFWAKAVNTACYVQNRVLVIKPHNKTPYELFLGIKPTLSFMRPFGCPVTILNTIDHLGKFDGKADEGFFVGYSTNSKAFRVFNSRIRIVEENLHVKFSEETHNIAGNGPNWLFDIDALTKSMNYEPVVAGNQSNGIADPSFSFSSKDSPDAGFKPLREEEKKDAEQLENEDSEVPNTEEPRVNQEQYENVNSTNNINTVSSTVNTASIMDSAIDENTVYGCVDDPNRPNLEEIVYSKDDEGVGAEADMNNLDTFMLDENAEDVDVYLYRSMIGSLMYLTSLRPDIMFADSPFDLEAYTDSDYAGASLDRKSTTGGCQFLISRLILWQCKKQTIIANSTTEAEYVAAASCFPVTRIEAIRLFLAYALFKGICCVSDGCEEKFGFSTVKTARYSYGDFNAIASKMKSLVKMEMLTLYRSMIGSLMYLTASRPDIMFVVCAYARFQVTPKVSHLHAVKRIFRYLKGNPQQEVLWIQNQMLDYGYNFMNTKIFIDNESTICIVKNLVFHSKTKHIEIRHHFIRDSYEKRLIQVIKIHTDHNVADLLTKAFDVSRFQYLIARCLEWNGTAAKDEIQVSVVRVTYYWKAKRPTEISQSSGPIPFVADETVIKE